MGFLVDGFCHGAIEDARLHFADTASLYKPFAAAWTGSELGFVILRSSTDSAGAGSYVMRTRVDGSGWTGGTIDASDTLGAAFPVCASVYEGGFVPWSPHYDSGAWSGVYSLEFVASLITATFAVWGLAFLGRSAWRIFR